MPEFEINKILQCGQTSDHKDKIMIKNRCKVRRAQRKKALRPA